jgi:hypothetical protein
MSGRAHLLFKIEAIGISEGEERRKPAAAVQGMF